MTEQLGVDEPDDIITGRGLVGRRTARLMIVIAGAIVALTASLSFATPNDIGPLFNEQGVVGWMVPAVGVLGVLIGVSWMVRIYRGIDPERGRSSFRSRN